MPLLRVTSLLSLLLWACTASATSDLKKDFVTGDPGVASIQALAFGPEGILFIGDAQRAMVHAIDTKDTEAQAEAQAIELERVDQRIAEALGTVVDQVQIQDMAVNPLSKTLYLAVTHQDGSPVLMRLVGEELEWVPLDQVAYSQKEIQGAYAPDAQSSRGRPLRVWTVSDLSYQDGSVMVSGLSNREFSSTFRRMAFPFQNEETDASLEIYHAAHGRYETESPVKAFTVAEVNGQRHLIAGYTCTPLVLFPLDELQGGQHTKGRTVAELGNWNTPLDMIVMEKEGESYLLIANSNRAVMKVKFADIAAFQGSLTERVPERSATAGVDFIALPWVNVLQLDKLDEDQFVMLKREANGDLNLITQGGRWL